MNKKWVVAMFSVFLVLVTVLRAQAALKDGVIGYWPMDNASMPEQNLAGTTTLSSSSGAAMFNSSCVVNGCYEFSSGTYYDFGNNALFDFPTQSFTVSFWCYSPSGANTNVVTSKFDGVSGWRAYCMGNNGYNTLLLQAYNSGVEKINTQSGTYDWNTWWYVTYIVDRTSNRAYLYVNGTMRVNNSVGGDVGTGGDFVIGAYTAGNNPFVGFLDELAIWNRSLSDSEVVEVFSNASWFSSGGSPPSVVKNVSLNNVFADSYFLVPPSNTTIYANFSSINVSIINVTGIIGSEVQFVQNYSDVWSFVLQSDVAALLNLTNVSAFDNESNRYDFTVFLQVNWTVPAGPVDNQNKSACFVANESITYFVVSNITDSTGNCVLVTASNVVVDLLGNTIFGGSDSSPSSVFRVLQADGVSNLTVKNGFVLNSDKRVFDTWTTLDVINVHVLNGSLSLYPTGGIYFLFRNSTRIFNSSVDANLGMTTFSGMISMSQHNNLLNNVVVTGNSRYGVRVSGTVLSAINGSTTIVDSALNVSDGVDVNAYGVTNFFVINSTLMGMVGWSEYTGATRRANLTIDTLSLFVGQNSGDVVFLNSLYSGFKNKQYYMNGSGVVMLSDVWSDSSRITKLVNGVFNSTVLPVGNRFSFSQDFGAYSELNISLGPNNVPSIPVLVSPANNSVLNVSEVFFNWSASDFEGDALNYALYLNSSLVLNINVSHFNLSYVANGNYSWFVRVSDGLNYSDSTTQYFGVNAPPPNISDVPIIVFVLPSAYTAEPGQTVKVNGLLAINESLANVSRFWIEYEAQGVRANYSMTRGLGLNFSYSFSKSIEGLYTFTNAYANSSSGNFSSKALNFQVMVATEDVPGAGGGSTVNPPIVVVNRSIALPTPAPFEEFDRSAVLKFGMFFLGGLMIVVLLIVVLMPKKRSSGLI